MARSARDRSLGTNPACSCRSRRSPPTAPGTGSGPASSSQLSPGCGSLLAPRQRPRDAAEEFSSALSKADLASHTGSGLAAAILGESRPTSSPGAAGLRGRRQRPHQVVEAFGPAVFVGANRFLVPRPAVRQPHRGGLLGLFEVELDKGVPVAVVVPAPGEGEAAGGVDLGVVAAAAVLDVVVRVAHDDAG